ncbi:MAG: disulfide bond formation protein B [Acidimicrobiia bacterium]
MDIEVLDRFFAALTVAGGVAGIGLVVWALVDLRGLGRSVGPLLLPLATLVATGATVGSLIYSEVFERIPCALCWYQRIFMYSAAVIGILALIRRRDRGVLPYMGTLATVGAAISVVHILDQNTRWFESPVCRADVPCSAKYVDVLGFVSIPVMALGSFILIAAACFIAHRLTGDET